MATRKKKVVAKKKSNGMMTMQQAGGGLQMSSEMQAKMDALLDKQKGTAPKLGGSDYIKTSGKGFTFGDNFLGSEIDVVIVGYAYFNTFFGYDSDYDPDNVTPAICFALSENQDDMSPHDNVKEPEADACGDCQWNKFKSARKGKGKACKNYIRIATVSADDLGGDAMPKIAYIRIPPASSVMFADFINGVIGGLKLPVVAVGVKLSIIEEEKAYSIGFETIGVIQDAGIIENKLLPRYTRKPYYHKKQEWK